MNTWYSEEASARAHQMAMQQEARNAFLARSSRTERKEPDPILRHKLAVALGSVLLAALLVI